MTYKIFGPDTKFCNTNGNNELERIIAETITKGRDVIFPIFNGHFPNGSEDISFFKNDEPVLNDSNPHQTYQSNDEILSVTTYCSESLNSFLIGSTIIPYDLIKVPKGEWKFYKNKRKEKRRNNTKEYRNQTNKPHKFLARPDLLVVKENWDGIHIFPIDIKNSPNNCDDGKQISMYNLGMLYFHSIYIRGVINHLQKKFGNRKIIFENGFYITDDIVSMGTSSTMPISNKRIYDIINFSEANNILNLLTRDEHLGLRYTQISEEDMVAQVRFLKNQFGEYRIFPIETIALKREGENKLEQRLSYMPLVSMQTELPDIEIIEEQIHEVYGMQPDELLEKIDWIRLAANDRKLESLRLELAKKREIVTKMQEGRIKNKMKMQEKSSWQGFPDDEEWAQLLEQRFNEINTLEERIYKINRDTSEKRRLRYRRKNGIKKGSDEWYKITEKKREELINELIAERKSLIKKRKK